MPTHRDLPDGFHDIAAQRAAEIDCAVERARRQRLLQSAEEAAALDRARATRSAPPPRAADESSGVHRP